MLQQQISAPLRLINTKAHQVIILYGIPNCDSVRAARKWLKAHQVDYRFHDLRQDGLDLSLLLGWVKELGWEALLNRRGLSWRELPEALRADIDERKAIQLMLDEPTLIKRPLLDLGDRRHIGFSDSDYRQLFT